MIKFIGISLCVLFCSLILKDYNRQIALLISFFGVCILLMCAFGELSEVVKSVLGFSELSSSCISYSKLMLKILGIMLISQFVCDICAENGENALASITAIIAKIIVVSMVLPLFETVISIIGGLVK